jgi:hypothetical protein
VRQARQAALKQFAVIVFIQKATPEKGEESLELKNIEGNRVGS